MDIVLCDDHAMVVASMVGLLEAHGHDVVATVREPEGLPEAVRRAAPDVCVTDLLFDDDLAPGRVVLDAISTVATTTDVVVISGVRREEDLEAARDAGAAALGSKAMSSTEIVDLIEGRVGSSRGARTERPRPSAFFLTDRELQVLQHLSDGDSTCRIAQHLGVRHATARSHVQSVLLKLGVHSRLAAVAVAVRHGLVEVRG